MSDWCIRCGHPHSPCAMGAERLRIRRALAPHVKRLRKDVCGVEQANIAKAIDAATRAPRKGKKRGK